VDKLAVNTEERVKGRDKKRAQNHVQNKTISKKV